MSCVVGVTDGTRVILGGDSASVNNGVVVDNGFPKVFNIGEMALGFVGSWRVGQVLSRMTILKESGINVYGRLGELYIPEKIKGVKSFMLTAFLPALQLFLRSNNALSLTNGKATMDGVIMVGMRGHLFTIWQEFQLEENVSGYEAIGAGRELALGALFATDYRSTMTTMGKVEEALAAAANFSTDVRKPFTFVNTL